MLPAYLKELGVEYHIVEKDTYSVVKELVPEGKTTCSLCSRLRRGTLYTFADEIGATKMALGHHRDDIVETFFLNMFFNGSLKGMPPKLRADDGRNVVIRPLAYCSEKDIQAYSDMKGFPIIPCNLCGSQENLQRQVVRTCWWNGNASTRAAPRASSALCRTSRHRSWPIATCSISPASRSTKAPLRVFSMY